MDVQSVVFNPFLNVFYRRICELPLPIKQMGKCVDCDIQYNNDKQNWQRKKKITKTFIFFNKDRYLITGCMLKF